MALIAAGIASAIAAVALGVYASALRNDLRVAEERIASLSDENAELQAVSGGAADEARELKAELEQAADRLNLARAERRALRRELAELEAKLREAAALGTVVECGDVAQEGAGVYGVSVQGDDCDGALAVARSWQDDCFFRRCDEQAPIHGYTCRTRDVGYEQVAVTCTDGSGAVVRFEAGS